MAPDKPKEDLTGLTILPDKPAANPDASISIPEPSQTIEHVHEFESIEELGMMDHVNEPTQSDAPLQAEPIESLEAVEPIESFSELPAELPVEAPADFIEEPMVNPVLADIQHYAEKAQETTLDEKIFYPFHLRAKGQFGPFERDKLLRFITENPIGVSSSDLDLQIQAGKVFFPRVSEYSGIKLIQELRDSGLEFSLSPSDRDDDEPVHNEASIHFHYDGKSESAKQASDSNLPILPNGSQLLTQYEEFDSLQSIQYLKAEMVEAEKSELFQEIIQRMIESLKHKARLKGADALTGLEQKITPLRLPSQYQVTLQLTLLRKVKTKT